MPVPQPTTSAPTVEFKSSIMRSTSSNPALERLRSRVLANADASDVITSYDRMHHRHSRS